MCSKEDEPPGRLSLQLTYIEPPGDDQRKSVHKPLSPGSCTLLAIGSPAALTCAQLIRSRMAPSSEGSSNPASDSCASVLVRTASHLRPAWLQRTRGEHAISAAPSVVLARDFSRCSIPPMGARKSTRGLNPAHSELATLTNRPEHARDTSSEADPHISPPSAPLTMPSLQPLIFRAPAQPDCRFTTPAPVT